MCGIAGLLDLHPQRRDGDIRAIAQRMAAELRHRGPDDSDTWADEAAGIAFGFQRLAILDLTTAGRQPMHSRSSRYTIVFNGEVYNYHDLQDTLEGSGAFHSMTGRSDTEVVLACIESWGLDAAVNRFVGMFAFALWDSVDRVLHLVRDRLGVKPLYYTLSGDSVAFGSELRALKKHPSFHPEIDRNAVAMMLRYGYVPAPKSIYQGVLKLPPGTTLTVKCSDKQLGEPRPYWSMRSAVDSALSTAFGGSAEDAITELDLLLKMAVNQRMIADVPLGVFLSGGVDSSLITALMQSQSPAPVKTFSVGFLEHAYNEAHGARAIAGHLRTDHTELILSSADVITTIPSLPEVYDEPFSDSSQLPTLAVAQLARTQVTVCLTGDGGDELFAGYIRHFAGSRIKQLTKPLPASVRRAAARSIDAWPRLWTNALLFSAATGGVLQRDPAEKLARLSSALRSDTVESMYSGLVSHWTDPTRLILGNYDGNRVETDIPVNITDDTHTMMFLDSVSYLPDDILVKVDRATMWHSLEARSPFLDHRVLEFAWRLPLSFKARQNEGKWILRRLLNRYMPASLFDRPKAGFSVPIGQWLRGPLREWAEALIDESRIVREGYFRPEPIRTAWREHLSQERNHQGKLWAVLMFQAWLDAQT